MDPDIEQDRLHRLDQDIDCIDAGDPASVVNYIVDRYRREYPEWPLWQLVQDMQRQAMVYRNIIEQLKSGDRDAGDVKAHFEDTLGLVPSGTLPNPVMRTAIERAFKKVMRYGTTLVVFVRDHGQELLSNELDVGTEHTVTIQVLVGLSPTLTLGTEYTKIGPGHVDPS